MSIVSDRLIELRERQGKTQEAVAEACNISRVTLARYENGTREPVAKNVSKLAEYYGVTVDYLLGREDPRQQEAEAIVDHYVNGQGGRPSGTIAMSPNPIIEARERIRKDSDRFSPETMSIIEGILDKLAQLDAEDLAIEDSHIDFLISRKKGQIT